MPFPCPRPQLQAAVWQPKSWYKITQHFFVSIRFPSLFCLLFAEVLLQLCIYTHTLLHNRVWFVLLHKHRPLNDSEWKRGSKFKKGNLSTGINNRKFGCKLKFTGKVLRCTLQIWRCILKFSGVVNFGDPTHSGIDLIGVVGLKKRKSRVM